MKYQMYSIHDSAVKVFLPPVYCRTHGEAERQFAYNVNQKDNGHLHRSPGNFTLFHVGEYDDETGQAKPCVPVVVMTGIQAKDTETDGQLRVAGT